MQIILSFHHIFILTQTILRYIKYIHQIIRIYILYAVLLRKCLDCINCLSQSWKITVHFYLTLNLMWLNWGYRLLRSWDSYLEFSFVQSANSVRTFRCWLSKKKKDKCPKQHRCGQSQNEISNRISEVLISKNYLQYLFLQ